ncbi:MAG: nitroreductase family protein [Candidatus Marinimicrobia bacterium]|nr:nitroreductase family protein [Candidatus Neomarinimicrobiota bacterium]|tara:strand:+ start:4799 stop:5569 length:771 start_codon:yes stop_codon:yes gene_type:complete
MSKNNILQNIPKHNHIEPAVDIDRDEFIKLIKSRRSVRVFTDEAVKHSDLKECIELALLAPTSSNLQCWEFYWAKSKENKEKLKSYCLSQSAATTSQELIVCVARIDTWKKNKNNIINYLKKNDSTPRSAIKYYEKIVPFVYSQGPFGIFGFLKKILISVFGVFKVLPREPHSISDMRVWAHKTTALACQNLMLALRAYGYDSCPMEGMDSSRIKKMLKLPKKAEICMVISVGKRAKNGVYGERFRLKSDEFIKVI